jgi:hypothetical protein
MIINNQLVSITIILHDKNGDKTKDRTVTIDNALALNAYLGALNEVHQSIYNTILLAQDTDLPLYFWRIGTTLIAVKRAEEQK